jgi:hypothetical protein
LTVLALTFMLGITYLQVYTPPYTIRLLKLVPILGFSDSSLEYTISSWAEYLPRVLEETLIYPPNYFNYLTTEVVLSYPIFIYTALFFFFLLHLALFWSFFFLLTSFYLIDFFFFVDVFLLSYFVPFLLCSFFFFLFFLFLLC